MLYRFVLWPTIPKSPNINIEPKNSGLMVHKTVLYIGFCSGRKNVVYKADLIASIMLGSKEYNALSWGNCLLYISPNFTNRKAKRTEKSTGILRRKYLFVKAPIRI